MSDRLPLAVMPGLFLLLLSTTARAEDKQVDYPNALAGLAVSGEFAPLFPFRVDHGSPDNITNVQTWDGPWKPAGSAGFVEAVDSRFVDETGPRYFTGTNICFSGCFPEHDQAEQVADDIARFGINLVRLHYVHHSFPPGRKYATPDSFIEPVQLEKFDYLFNQLKRRGISVYMQLNIARKFGTASGFENAKDLPWYNNGIDNIEPQMIALQQKYVRDLLNHVNPYTKLAYKDEPAIITLELANENSVVKSWYRGLLDSLPSPYAEQFTGMWNDWLQRKYQTTAALRTAWKCRNDPLGDEMIPDGRFGPATADSKDYPAWGFQQDAQSQSEWTIAVDKSTPAESRHFSRLQIDKLGKTPNIPQFFCRCSVVEGTQYNLSFKLRASRPCQVSVLVSQDHNPWHVAGFRTTFEASETWQDYSFSFLASMSDPKVRLVFADFAAGTTVDIADVSLRSGGLIGLDETETLEAGTVPLPYPTGPKRYHLPAILADMNRFLFECEDAYFRQMEQTVKQEVHAPQPVTGTQLNYGFFYPQGRFDYCDIHSYWCHPSAPGGGSWTNPKMREFWFMRNIPLVNATPEQSTITKLAVKRILNRPYTVSEYDHPFPNLYAAEGNLMLYAMAAFQNWNAVMHFAWTHNADYDPQVMTGYFDMKTNSVKQVHHPACYAMFTRGDVRRGPGQYRYTLKLSERQEREANAQAAGEPGYYHPASLLKPDAALSLAVVSGMDLTDLDNSPPIGLSQAKAISSFSELPAAMGSPEQKWIRNEFGELHWNLDAENGGYFTVDTPRTKVFTGFVRQRSFDLRGLTLRPGKTRLDWATISLVKASGEPARDDTLTSGRYLLAATGLMQNTGMVLKNVGSDRVSTAAGYGGKGGEAPILCEGIPATLTLKTNSAHVTAFALDQAGNRAQSVPVEKSASTAEIQIGPKYRTLWYELVIE